MLSKKYYEMIAEIINDSYDSNINVYNNLINNLCNKLEQDNPNFDRERFINACKGL